VLELMRVDIIRDQVPLAEVDAVMRPLIAAGIVGTSDSSLAASAASAVAVAAAQGGLDDHTTRLLQCAVEVHTRAIDSFISFTQNSALFIASGIHLVPSSYLSATQLPTFACPTSFQKKFNT
jgi:hypothetical protein